MADREYVFVAQPDSVTVKTSWKRYQLNNKLYSFDITTGVATTSFEISGIDFGAEEYVKKAVVTSSRLNYGTSDSGAQTHMNGLTYSKVKKIDPTGITNGSIVELTFSLRASGNTGTTGSVASPVTSTLTSEFSDITLTLTVGSGSAFDGKIASVNEGDKIFINEFGDTAATVSDSTLDVLALPETGADVLTQLTSGDNVTVLACNSEWARVDVDGAIGYVPTASIQLPVTGLPIYTLVHHGYNTGKALLFRDQPVGKARYRASVPSSASNNIYQQSTLDKYLVETWYPTLASSATDIIQSIDYPVGETNNSTTSTPISRMAGTISAIESGLGGYERFGAPLDYTGTLACDDGSYWTRESVGGTANYAYCVNNAGTAAQSSTVVTSLHVRPTIGVLEDQMVCLDELLGVYVSCSQHTAPTQLLLDGEALDKTNQNIEVSYTLSWDEGVAGKGNALVGYAVWYSEDPDGEYQIFNTTTETSMLVPSPSRGFKTRYYKVQSLADESVDFCSSELSTAVRSVATKRSNVYYFDGNRWMLAVPNYYQNGTWKTTEGMNYYNGSSWIIPGD